MWYAHPWRRNTETPNSNRFFMSCDNSREYYTRYAYESIMHSTSVCMYVMHTLVL